MKKITLSLLTLFSAIIIIAQSPQAFKYQTVVRDNSGAIISNQALNFRISILDDNAAGPVAYQETHLVNTNDFGLASMEVGNGTPVSGIMSDVDWSTNDKFLQIEMDEAGGTNYQLMGTSQLLSVPYALHAQSTSDTSRWKKNGDDLYYSVGKVGIGSSNPGAQLHLFSTENTSRGIAIGAQGLLPNQQSYLEFITFGDGTETLGQEDNIGWHLTGRGASYGGITQRHDLLLSHWNGDDWKEIMYFDTTGYVGIGSSTPGSQLQIFSTENVSTGISIGAQGLLPFQQSYLELITVGDGSEKLGDPDNKGWHLTGRGASYGGITQRHDLLLSHWNGIDWNEVMYFDTTGNVGIGTTNPLTKLHINNGSGSGDPTSDHIDAFIEDDYAYLEFSGSNFGGITFKDDNTSIHSGIIYNYSDDKLQFRVGNAEFLSLDESGNLGLTLGGKFGIGTSTPAFPLDVNTSTELRSGYFYNTTNSTQTTFGLYSGAYGVGSGDKRGGSFEAYGGSGENIGVKALAMDGTTNIAIHGDASGGTTNWAGYFESGNVHIENRLGIGTTSPGFPIDVNTSTALRSGYFYNTTNTTQTTYGLWGGAYGTGSGDNRGGAFEAVGGTGENVGVRALAMNGSSNIAVYGFASGGISNWAGYFDDGNVYVENNMGIGTLSPTQKLHISGGDIEVNDGFPWIYLDATTSSGNSGIYFQNQNSTGASLVFNKNSNYLRFDNSTGNHSIVLDELGIGFNTTSPDFDIHIIGNDLGDIAEFYNVNTGTNADVLRAKVNITTPSTAQYFYRCVGGDDGSDGGVRADGSGGVYFATVSDRRLKMNIEDFSGALSILDMVQPRQYEMKQAPGISQYGFVAQELNSIYPMAVIGVEKSNSEDEPMMIDYSKITPLLAGATKELHQIVKKQQAEIDQLRKELEGIKKLLEKQ